MPVRATLGTSTARSMNSVNFVLRDPFLLPVAFTFSSMISSFYGTAFICVVAFAAFFLPYMVWVTFAIQSPMFAIVLSFRLS